MVHVPTRGDVASARAQRDAATGLRRKGHLSQPYTDPGDWFSFDSHGETMVLWLC